MSIFFCKRMGILEDIMNVVQCTMTEMLFDKVPWALI